MLRFLQNKVNPAAKALRVSKTFSVPLADFADTGERDAILASSGMGKSYLTGVLMEETLENGIPICLIDPEGEHFTLAEKYPCLIVGGQHAQVPFDPDAVDLYTEAMVSAGLSTIFDLSDYIDAEQQEYYAVIVDSLFRVEQKYRRKIRLIVEEAQIYAPQGGLGAGAKKKLKGADSLTVSQRIAKRGRKRAIDSLWATQRPASLSKDILSQCNRFWFGGITSELDYKAIRPFLNEAGISFNEIKSLQPGQFYFYAKGKTEKIQVRKRFCKHAGATPNAGVNFQAATDKALDAVLGRLSKQIDVRAAEIREEQSEIQRMKEIIRKLEKKNEDLREELERERMATKVIQRINGVSSDVASLALGDRESLESLHEQLGDSDRPRRSGRSKKLKDSGDTAIAASSVVTGQLAQLESLQL
jgi:Helicase HerA, central domain